ncbi:MAG TPA: tetratricopeptide repeat protein, partial [Thermoplasmata archaeon]|nr:tetratricopeptide repeat protein [Thermoplasmata archaeon]
EFYDFMEREVSVSLSPIETGILTASALARYPLSPDAFLSSRIAFGEEEGQSFLLKLETDVSRAIISLKEKNLVVEGTYGVIDSHDLLKDFFKSKTSTKLRKSIHLALSQFYIDGDSPFSANEAVHHLVEAGDLDSALEVAKVYGHEILERVGFFTLHAFLEASLASNPKYLGEPGFLLLRAEIYEMEGNLDFALDALKRISSPCGQADGRVVAAAMRLQGNILTRKGSLETAQDSLVKGKEIASSLGDPRLRGSISCDLGNLFYKRGMLTPARENLEEAMKDAKEAGDDVLRGRSLYGIAKIVSAGERYEEAISIEKRSLDILRQTGALSDQARVLSSMGICYDAIGKYEEALRCQDEAYGLSVRAGDVYTQGYSLVNAASTLLRSRNFDDAKKRTDKASSIAKMTGDVPMLSFLALLEGEVRGEKGEWDSAENCFKNCIELAEKSGLKYYLANWHIDIGNFYASHGKNEAALAYLLSAKEICESNSLRDLADYVSQQISAVGRGGV